MLKSAPIGQALQQHGGKNNLSPTDPDQDPPPAMAAKIPTIAPSSEDEDEGRSMDPRFARVPMGCATRNAEPPFWRDLTARAA